MKKLLILSSIFIILSLCISCEAEKPITLLEPLETPYEHVVLIGIDGGGQWINETNTPKIFSIFENNAYNTSSLAALPTISAQNWGSMLHGVTPSMHGLKNGTTAIIPYPLDSSYPSIFKVIYDADNSAQLASFSSWMNINYGIIEDLPNITKISNEHGTIEDDIKLKNDILSYLDSEGLPKLLFVQFDSADEEGHGFGYGSDNYLNVLKTIDSLVTEIYEKYQSLDSNSSTLFIVTADHGGKGTSHGGDSIEEKNVFLGFTGNNIKNEIIAESNVYNIAPTILYALGLNSPSTYVGYVLDIFE